MRMGPGKPLAYRAPYVYPNRKKEMLLKKNYFCGSINKRI